MRPSRTYDAQIAESIDAVHRVVCLEALVNRVTVLGMLGRNEEARTAAAEALRFMRPDDPNERPAPHRLLCTRSTAAFFTGDYAAAVADYEAALAIVPEEEGGPEPPRRNARGARPVRRSSDRASRRDGAGRAHARTLDSRKLRGLARVVDRRRR
jgi:hypothetical protein